MKRSIAILLSVCLCFSLLACGGKSDPTEPSQTSLPVKSAEAQRAEALISAIGEVTIDSEALIHAAQEYYDSLTPEQKQEVENYALLQNAHKDLVSAKHDKIADLISQGSCMEASILLSELSDAEDYDQLVLQCANGAMVEYVTKNGTKTGEGNYLLTLKASSESVSLRVLYTEESNRLQLQRIEQGSLALMDLALVNIIPGSESGEFARQTMQFSTQMNYQEGNIYLQQYTGSYTGSLADNSLENLTIHGLKETVVQTAYDEQTRGYKVATMRYINEMLDAFFKEITDAGFEGPIVNLIFPAYKVEG